MRPENSRKYLSQDFGGWQARRSKTGSNIIEKAWWPQEWHLDRLAHPESLTIIGTIFALLLLLLAIRRLRRGRLPYQRSGPLCSPAELHFLRALERAAGESASIYAKVRLADLVEVRESVSGRRFWQAFNAISRKHVDYVLCDPDTLEVICVIELDDRSHQRDDRRERDEFVDNVMQAARIPMLRFPAQTRYRTTEVRRRLENTLSRHDAVNWRSH